MASNRAQILIRAVDETRGAFDAVKRGLGGLADAARSVNGVLAGLGVALSAAGLGAMVKSALESADALNKLSQRVGITVESLSTLVPAAELSGVSAQTFETGLKKLATAMLEAATGSEESARRFAALGVAFQDQDGRLRATDAVLLDLADRFQAMPDGAQKSALAVQLFGKSGSELIPFLNQGREGIAALTGEMQALGVQIGGDTAAQAEAFNDALAKVKLATTSIANRVIEAFLPAMNEMAGGMVESAKQGGTLRAILDGIVLVLKTLALGAATVGKAFVALGEAIGAGMAAAVEALRGNTAGAKAIIGDLKGSLIKRLDELAEFRDSLFDPKPIEVQAPKVQADPALLQRLTAPGKTRDTASARAAWMQARLDAEFTLLKDGLRRQQTALDAALEDRLVSLRDYYARKTALEQQEIDAEIARTQQALARSRQLASGGKSEEERLRGKAEVARLEAELIALNNKRADVEQSNARAAAKAERELADALAAAREELARLTGTDTAQDRRAAIERGYRDLRARLLAESDADGVSLIDRLIDVKAAQANLEALEAQWRQVTERLRNAQEGIQIQQQAGLLTEAQARQQIVALQRDSAAEMARLLPAMEQAAQAIGPEAVLRVAAWRNELTRTRLVTDELAPVWNRIGEAFGQAVQGIVSGAQSLREALSNIFRSIADAFLQEMVLKPFQQWVAMQARMLAIKLGLLQQEQAAENAAAAQSVATKQAEAAAKVSANAAEAGSGAAASQAAIPVVGPGLAIAAMVAMVAAVMALLGNIKKFAAGGYVTGPGTSTSDSIPARLSAGEYVVRTAAVQRVGVAFLDAINGLRTPPTWDGQRLAFAAGGLVPQVNVPPAQPQVSQSVRIVNAIDPGVTHDHLQTPAGERVILNIIGRNARAVRAALQG
ncbi:putative nucleic acid-binding Zn-ribbon protein [Sulfuritortus calidifontis]|uniref:Putative nucleic acid-binding Zn-ribbon protein n=1 Tax=Sulfuritortus calidifontis TaxID=1914471 RepID=A0A4R3JVF1_9PROT|nr:phage tail protein [Sulfuritortus calidifontis]TCS71978.1 putative nucleic acid-binding Zn-ribbon protein [Sulfuritortus calidifontis]